MQAKRQDSHRRLQFGFCQFFDKKHDKKVYVDCSLNDPSSHGDAIIKPFVAVSVEPVEDVENFVSRQCREIENNDAVCLGGLSLVCDC